MRRLWFVLLAGCYSPHAVNGSPCQTDSDCPSTLVCSDATKTCESENVAPDAMDAHNRTCWEAWLAGPPTFGTVRRMDDLSSASGESDASLAENDLAIYFERSDMTTMGPDIFRATRASASAPWMGAAIVTEFQSSSTDSRAGTAVNGTIVVFASTRPGGVGGSDLFYATQSTGGGWSLPDQALLTAVNTTDSQFDPELSPDGLVLYYSTTPPTGQILAMARRQSVTDPFGAPTNITPSGALAESFDPTISPDGRVILFSSAEVGKPADLYMATRANIDTPFGAAQLLSISSPQLDGDPELSQDGCHVIFDSNRTANRDFYTVDIIP